MVSAEYAYIYPCAHETFTTEFVDVYNRIYGGGGMRAFAMKYEMSLESAMDATRALLRKPCNTVNITSAGRMLCIRKTSNALVYRLYTMLSSYTAGLGQGQGQRK